MSWVASLFVLLVSATASASAPTTVTNPASGITTSSAVLNGTGSPNSEQTTGWFRISSTNPVTCNDTFGTRVPATSGTDLGMGNTAVPYSITTTGLSPGTTYYFCSIVQNASGTAFGAVLSFTIPSAPVVLTTGATNVGSTSATLGGSANPVAAATTGWFRYSSTNPSTCNDTFGTRVPSSGGANLGSGTSSVDYTFGTSSLLPGTTYYYCAIASNAQGTSFGSVMFFTTAATAPIVSTTGATSITTSAATLNGSANPRGDTTTAWFRYSTTSPGSCNDTFGTRTPATGGTNVGSDNTTTPFMQSLTGLTLGTTYYYCAIAQNSIGISFGSVSSFTTLGMAPDVTTVAASSITGTTATLNAAATPNGSSTTGWFRYATTNPGTCNDTFGIRAPTSSGTALGAGLVSVPYSRAIGSLVPATTYYFCAIAQNGYGTSFGSVLSFTTPALAPTVTTSTATVTSGSAATLNGAANPNGDTTTGWFRYATTSPGSCNDTFGTRAPTSGGTNVGSGLTSVAFSEPVTGLLPGTTYYYCAIGSNSIGMSFGSVLSFTTPAPPTVTTTAATGLSDTSATLNGTGNPNRATTTGWFRYATTNPGTCNDTFGSRAPTSGGSNLGAGSSSVAFAQTISGLSPGATYYYCAIAQNSEGMAFGTVLQLTTLASPTVTTNAATLVTASSAQLNGAANPNGNSATGWYRYATTNPGTCNDTFGIRAPTSGGTALGSGTMDLAYARSISGLVPATTYYYCAIASNSFGTGFGAVMSFTTPAAAPVVSTNSPTNLTGTTAQLNGSGNPGGDATTGWFRYATTSPGSCNDTFGTRAPMSGGTALGSGTASVAFAEPITGLTPNTTYFYCAIGQNSVGIGFGSVLSFTTPAPPTVVTNAATVLSDTSAQLSGTGNPNRATTTGWFRYATTNPGTCNDTFGSRAPVTGGTSLGAGSSNITYTQSISGLSPGTTYYYCAIAQNSEGTAFGSVLSFTTFATPTVTTTTATSVTATTAQINGSANPNGSSTTGWFRYATTNPGTCNDTFGTRIPTSSGTALGNGTADVAYNRALSGLTPATTYYFCAIASNSFGTGFGSVLSFTTPAIPPTISTGAVTMATGTMATLNGTANPNGDTTTAWFRFATASPGTCNDSFGTRAPTSGGSAIGSGTSAVAYSQGITGLLPATTYYYCAIGQNSLGTSFGSVLSFTTPAPPLVTTVGASNLTSTSAQLDGNANPNRATTTGWFRYSATNPGTCNDTFGSRAPVTGGSNLGAGSSAIGYSQSISGLSTGVTYYYCAIAQNSEGTSFGALMTFTTLSAPTVTTTAATNVLATSTQLNGTGNPNGATATGWFRYDTTSPGTCNDTFGIRTPSSGGTALGAGTTAVAYSRSIGTTPGTTYYYCAIASNVYGTSVGTVMTFTTPALAPTVTTSSASPFTGTTAQLNGSANPNGDATTAWFRYATVSPGTCNDSFGMRAPASGGSALGGGTTAVAFSQSIAGLTQATTYYYCAIAQNSIGISFGSVLTFTTAAPPVAVTSGASSISSTSASLDGTANPNRATTTGYYRISSTNPGTCNDTFGTRVPAVGGTNVGAGSTAVGYSITASGLSPATTYYFCALATNGEGMGMGSVLSFTTLATPTVTTNAATSITATAATLNGMANPNGASATGWYRYDTTSPGTCNDSFGIRIPSSGGTALGAGTADVTYARAISGLLPGTTYYFCALASNTVGTGFGSVLSFTTPANTPTVTTNVPTGVTTTTATLNGAANPNGAATTGWFRISTTNPGACDDVFGARVPNMAGTALGAGNTTQTFSQSAPGIAPGTTYYYCAIAQSSAGTGFGAIRSFTTPATPTVNTLAATPVTATSATLNANANPNGNATTGWFRYATVDPGTCDDVFGTRAPTSGGAGLGAGTSPVSYAQALTGLAPATTYYFCALAQSSIGTSYGAVLSFTTPPTAPVVTTQAATGIGPDVATLNASGNPNGQATTAYFRYATTNPGICNDTFGTRAPTTGGTSLGSGNTTAPFSQALTGLTAGTTYFYCGIATNAQGTGFGSVLSFTTANAPSVTTTAATAVASTTATLNGSANPNQLATTGWFRYDTTNPGTCNDTFGTRAPTTGGTSLGSGQSAAPYSQALTGLAAGTTYYFCALAQNSVGTSVGNVLSFTTSAVPTVSTDVATAITSTSATLAGNANPNGTTATGWFRYSTVDPGTCNDTFGTRAPTSGGTALGAGTAAVAYTRSITGLVAGTTYYYCAIASNTVGTGLGTVMSFTTAGPPTVTTDPATGITTSAATLNGTANPNQGTTTAWFRYATTNPGTCNDTFGTRAPATGGASLGAGTTGVPYSQAISGLATGTTYYYCAIASNANGTRFGTVQSFSTGASAPVAVTSAASAITSTSATLNANGTPNGAATTGWFRYATTNPGTCDDVFGTRAPATGGTALGSGNAAVAYSRGITGLSPGTTVYFCAIVQSSIGTSFGSVLSFTTSAAVPTVTTAAPSAIGTTTATLEGSANPNGGSATGYFRYASTDPGTCNDTFGTRAPTTGGAALGAGTADVPFSQPITGLASGVTYYYCAIASNTPGKGFGALMTFTTTVAPTVTTVAASAISSTTATVNGTANPNGVSASGYFRYATTSPGTCNDTFGTRAPTTGGAALGAGTTAQPYSQTLSGLASGTTYYYCALATSASGTGLGAVMSFSTPGAPSVTTVGVTGTTGTMTTLNGSANPNSAATTAWFRYATTNPGICDDSFGTRAPATGGSSLGAGTSPVAYTQQVMGLSAGTTYYFCAIAQNSIGTSVGAIMTFTTPAAPTVTSLPPTALTATAATLQGTANPNFAPATGWFRYDTANPGTCNDTFGTRAPTTGGTSLGGGNAAVPFSQPITGLAPVTTYYACAIASNSEGTAFGSVITFTTPVGPPTVTTLAPTSVAGDMATLNGSANPNGDPANGYFRYSATDPGTCNDTFGTRFPATGGTTLGGGTTAVTYSNMVTGLVPMTTYYYCAIATNTAGAGFGQVVSFVPGAVPPTVTTLAASNIDGSSAMIAGTANPNASAATGWFRYGITDPGACSDSFGSMTPSTNLGAGTTAAPYQTALTGLDAKQQYFYCAAASNAGGAAFGTVMSFTTAAVPPVVKTDAPTINGAQVTLNGAANPKGAETTAWFRYGDTDPGTCNDTFGTRTAMQADANLGGGRADVPFVRALADLEPGTYYACAIAKNEAGTAFGQVVTFDVNGGDGGGGGGCGCRTGAPSKPAVMLVVVVAFVVLRRRRQSSSEKV